MGLENEESRARLGRWLLALAVLGSALGLGALHTPVLCACALVAAAATALLWYDAEPLDPRSAATLVVAVGVGLVLWTALQIVPLPRGVLGMLASESADVWAHCLSPLREDGPAFAPLSLDATATRVQILRGMTYLVVFVGALRVARRAEGVAFLERTLLVSSTAVAGAALVHPVLGARKVFGVYEPAETYAYFENHVGPLLNTNHLAAYANVGLILAVACVVERRDAIPRLLALVIALLLGATTVWTYSRGGIAAMAIGAVLATVLSFGARRAKRLRIAASLALALTALGGTFVFLLSAFDQARNKFASGNLMKLGLAKNAIALVREFPIFGTGRGAFESAFPHVREGTGYWVFTHPENILAQWTSEWGIPVASVAFLALAWALRPKTALARSRPPAGAWAVLVAVAVHNLVDFSSEVPAVVMAVAVCAAIVTGGTGGRATPPRFSGWAARPTALALGAAIATVAAIAATLPFSANELYNEERAFRDLALDRAITRDDFRARAREVMLRHPAEAYFPFVGAVRATTARDESILPWAGRALERSPIFGRTHLLLARTLFVANPSQARLEYRTACFQDARLCALEEVLRLVGDYDDAMALVPEGAGGMPTLLMLTRKLALRLPSTVVALDREIIRRNPGATPPVERATARTLGDLRDGAAWCQLDQAAVCAREGLEAARGLRAAAPELCGGHALVAELLFASGQGEDGLTDLDAALERIQNRSDCGRRLVMLSLQTKNAARIDASLDRLVKLACESTVECSKNLLFAARVERDRGNRRQSVVLLRKAWELDPENDTLLADVARQAEAEKVFAEATDAYQKLADRHPTEQQWVEALRRVRQAATRNVILH